VTEFTRQRWGHEDEELLCIAAGHDLLEDTKVTWQFLYDNFGFRVANGILALSKVGAATHSYGKYQNNVLSNVDAMKVKLCDLRHNMQAGRVLMDENTEKRMDKYAKFRDLIEEKLVEIGVS
jgi:(p)ppGpp synthase/HD superfamily hydrolase